MKIAYTLTRKLQLTLPADVVRRLSIKRGDKLAVSTKNGRIILTPETFKAKEAA